MKTLLPTTRPLSAFTLMEVMIAVVASAMVLVAASSVFYGGLQLRNRASDSVEAQRPIQYTVSVLRRDLANLVYPGGTLAGQLQTPGISTGTNVSTTPATLMPSGNAIPLGAEFYTASAPIDTTLPWGDIQKVSYSLIASATNMMGRDLYRSVSRNLLAPILDEPVQEWLMGGVEDVLFSFYDGRQWISTWDSSTSDPKLPTAIKATFFLVRTNRVSGVQPSFELVVPLLLQGRTNTTLGIAPGGATSQTNASSTGGTGGTGGAGGTGGGSSGGTGGGGTGGTPPQGGSASR